MSRPNVALQLNGVPVNLDEVEVKALRSALYDRVRLEMAVARMPEALPRQRARARIAAARVRGVLRLLSGSLAPQEFPEYRRAETHDFASSNSTAVESE